MVKTVMFTNDSKILGVLGKSANGRRLTNKSVTAGATYRAVGLDQTCPSDCAFLRGGHEARCYATKGNVAIHMRRSGWSENDGETVREFIAGLPRHHLLRHHVSGDLGRPGGAVDEAYVDGIVAGHKDNPGVKGWMYTHFHRQIDPARVNFPGLTTNASADTFEEAADARRRGWPTVVVLPKDEHRRRFKVEVAGEILDVVRCPQQGNPAIGCATCRLCLRSDRALVVGFVQH